MKIRLFNLLTGLSLVLCVATCTLWIRSCWWQDSIQRQLRWDTGTPTANGFLQLGQWQGMAVAVESYSSRLVVAVYYWRFDDAAQFPPVKGHPEFPLPDNRGKFCGLEWSHHQADGAWCPGTGRGFSGIFYDRTAYGNHSFTTNMQEMDRVTDYYGAYDWLIVLVTAILPTAYAACAVTRLRRKRNPFACLICGYDLRATPNRCPECGTVPAKAGAP